MDFYISAHQIKDNILVTAIEKGKKVKYKVPYKPTLYMDSRKPDAQFKTLSGSPVDSIQFDSISDAKDFFNKYSDVANMKLYGLTDYIYTYIFEKYRYDIDYDSNLLNIIVLDIEVKSDEGFPTPELASKEITAITVRKKGYNICFGCGSFTPKDKNTTYVKCKNEEELLEKFLELWCTDSWRPDIVTGWNIETFDIPYLVNRITNVLSEEKAKLLSPWKMIHEKRINLGYKEVQSYNILGVNILDYMVIYKKFTYTQQESYSLDYISSTELGEKKLDYSGYGSLMKLYRDNFQLFMEYNIHDCALIDRLEEKLGFIEQVLALAYDAKVLYNDTLATVKPWDVIIHNYLMEKGIVVPFYKPSEEYHMIPGGYVKDPIPGKYKWPVSFDLTSLYPHIIMQYNISAETFRGKLDTELEHGSLAFIAENMDFLKEKNYSCTGNYCLYDNSFQGFLPRLMEKMFEDREKYKEIMKEVKKENEKNPSQALKNKIARYNNLQMSKKIQLNSAYGALANMYFRWFSMENASAVTTSGQMTIKFIGAEINKFMNKIMKTEDVDYIITMDTDSAYISFDAFVQKYLPDVTDTDRIVDLLDKVCREKIEPYIKECFVRFKGMTNARVNKMKMKREAIADVGIFIVKKRYAMSVYDNEGVRFKEPELKITGIEAVRSSTPKVCREKIKQALTIIMYDDVDKLKGFIDDFKKEFMKLNVADIACPSTANNLDKYTSKINIYEKKTPMHVKGALLYNKWIKDKKLTEKYPAIKEGDKIKYICLKKPNPIFDTAISISTVLPDELMLDRYIDKETQFQKTFVNPIEKITDIVGWDISGKATFEDLWI